MRREWFQDPRTSSKISWPHYDISAQRRQVALSLGAIAVGRHQTIAMSRVTINQYFGIEGTEAAIDPLAFHRRLNSASTERVAQWLSQELAVIVSPQRSATYNLHTSALAAEFNHEEQEDGPKN